MASDLNDSILIRGHLGLGDMLVCNAIFREYAKSHNVLVPCKGHNVVPVEFMLRDAPNCEVRSVADDAQADELCRIAEKLGCRVLKLGMFGTPPFDSGRWGECMYRQAGIPFRERWDSFYVQRQALRELPVPDGPFCFIHEDLSRGFAIDRSRLPADLPWVFADPGKTQNLFDWWGIIEQATELHLIDSSFAIMADSVPVTARRKVIHLYARKGALPPTYVKDWEILKS